MQNVYEFDTTKANTDEGSGELFYSRERLSCAFESTKEWKSEVTLILCAYNRLEKTKQCIESVIKYSNDVDYDMILVDNGSTDDTFEYFKSLNIAKKRVIRINQNLNSAFSDCCIDFRWISNYCVLLQNDLILTKNWLSNLLKVAKSDPKIGFVNPLSSNASNYQMYNIEFNDLDEMQKIAAEFNVSDPKKWQERIRMVILGSLIKKEALYAIGWPVHDIGFIHDFGDDDISFRIRRAGYKNILAGDTWIHHNHTYGKKSDRDINEFNASIKNGRENFKKKFYGIDSWNDANEYVYLFLNDIIKKPSKERKVRVLGIDCKCGTPILDIKNKLRSFDVYDPELYAFTTDAKYYIDLNTICQNSVVSDRIEFLNSYYESEFFDYIIFNKNINEYNDIETIIKTALSILKSGGQIFVPLKNVYSVMYLLKILGYVQFNPNAFPLTIEDFLSMMKRLGAKSIEKIHVENWSFDQQTSENLVNMLNVCKSDLIELNPLIEEILPDRVWFEIKK